MPTLLSLPPELRLIIYSFLPYTTTHREIHIRYAPHPTLALTMFLVHTTLPTSILLTCRLFNTEATPIFAKKKNKILSLCPKILMDIDNAQALKHRFYIFEAMLGCMIAVSDGLAITPFDITDILRVKEGYDPDGVSAKFLKVAGLEQFLQSAGMAMRTNSGFSRSGTRERKKIQVTLRMKSYETFVANHKLHHGFGVMTYCLTTLCAEYMVPIKFLLENSNDEVPDASTASLADLMRSIVTVVSPDGIVTCGGCLNKEAWQAEWETGERL
ncbi:hypothetical protein B0J11DRAFT_346950 [Dendryphion nanum]|uniref:F-box domain-containing protein n=1 Tax=Dendryphion nanum TaxID=256645 RepID=A0A9P9DNK3_9PLEO|nr:hypothetical protein B0J11DRAFT_346950 [Dendryphion nanum]